ncbi:hypothetical protein D3C84_615980 [compost metagenome]
MITKNMKGKALRISSTRIIRLSTRPPMKPEAAPYRVPMMTATTAPMMPTMSEMRPPSRVRTNRSRPRLSVPNQCPVSMSGAACMAPQSGSSKVYWDRCGPTITARPIMVRMMRLVSAALLRRKRRRASFHRERPSTTSTFWANASMASRFSVVTTMMYSRLSNGSWDR